MPIIERAMRHDTTGGADTAQSLAADGQCFMIEQDGRPVMAYVLQPQGSELYVLAASGAALFDLTAFGLALIEAQAVGFESVAFQTRRRGLVKKAQRHGYQIAGRVHDGVVMRKRLT